MTPTVFYRPEPSVWLFVVFTVSLIVLGFLRYTGEQYLSGEYLGQFLLFWPLSVALLWSGRKPLILTRDDRLGCVRVELRRWPFASKVTTYPLAEVRDAIVEVDPMGETFTHRVALVLASGVNVPLTDFFCSHGAHHERAAREIRALLGSSG